MKKVMIVIDTSRASGRKFLAGAEKYISSLADWEVYLHPPDYLLEKYPGLDLDFPLEQLDGLLIRDVVNSNAISDVDVPRVINDTLQESIPGASTIVTDSIRTGQIAAEHFLGLGFNHFAFCGFKGFAWSQKRLEGYRRTLLKQGIDDVFNFEDVLSQQPRGESERQSISRWLRRLPRPVCVFACNDDRAISVLEACKIAGRSVPEEVAVLGVDNDELVCNLSAPSLSSIELDFENAGQLAARHLNELIQRRARTTTIHVAPLEIVERRSTDVLAVSDQNVIAALIFIRSNYHKPIQVLDVVKTTELSRRELERRFKATVKRTIQAEIQRLRIELIKKQLLSNGQPIYRIADELEFTDPEHFSRYFKHATGQSPTQFRRRSHLAF